ncbi:hypothetical protein RRG08_042510 [Elysia crispata]|uniref:Uncharacterized protein n=1 Tax=Elysia crispata TaxID=231223 RepID=A0AAE1CK85_9GAST|nr:hypothetical protein RRG08_042510 [Elysia crispata]
MELSQNDCGDAVPLRVWCVSQPWVVDVLCTLCWWYPCERHPSSDSDEAELGLALVITVIATTADKFYKTSTRVLKTQNVGYHATKGMPSLGKSKQV